MGIKTILCFTCLAWISARSSILSDLGLEDCPGCLTPESGVVVRNQWKRLAALGLLLFLSSGVEAAIYKCKDANGKVSFSDKPCQGTEQQPLSLSTERPENTSYLATEDGNYSYQTFLEKFQCNSVNRGLSIFPGRNTLSSIISAISAERGSRSHKLQRSSESNQLCYVRIEKSGSYTWFYFGIDTTNPSDVSVWSAHDIARKLARRGYQFKDMDNDFKNSYSFKWRTLDFSCELIVYRHAARTSTDVSILNVGTKCSARG